MWFALALFAFTLVARVPLRWWEWAAVPAYVITLVLLAVTLVVGTGAGTAVGTKSWIGFGAFRFQPSELAKLATVLALARLLSTREEAPTGLRELLAPGLLVGAPLAFVMLQPDLGSGMAFVGVLYAMLYWAGDATAHAPPRGQPDRRPYLVLRHAHLVGLHNHSLVGAVPVSVPPLPVRIGGSDPGQTSQPGRSRLRCGDR